MIEKYLNEIIASKKINEKNLTLFQWNKLFNKAKNQGLAPIFYIYFRESNVIPQFILLQAKKEYEDALIYKDYSISLLKEMAFDLCNAGKIILIKGIALYEDIYKEPLMRTMSDIDLYIPNLNEKEIQKILKKYGFTNYKNYKYLYSNNHIFIDIHTDLWGIRRIEARKYLCSQIEESYLPSKLIQGFYLLSNQLTAIYSAYHCVKHNFYKKIWIFDIVLEHKKGYFNDVDIKKIPYVGFVLNYLQNEKIINNDFILSGNLPKVKKIIFNKIASRNNISCLGEIALALSCPSLVKTFLYLVKTLFPSKSILIEMYGKKPFCFLFLIRIFNLIKYFGEFILCPQK